VLAAADEAAVELFLSRKIGFSDIPAMIERVLELHRPVAQPVLEEITAADAWARGRAFELASGGKHSC
jgi:1-deoxy-D-xylulose-5-phosphate reductoisomerase